MLPQALQAVLKQRPVGLVFDIDGTLSPIAPTPGEARLYPGIAQSLRRASEHAEVAIVTGRAVASGAAMVNVEGLTYIGTHGLEWSTGLPSEHSIQLLPEAQPYIQPGNHLLDLAERELGQLPGILIERKVIGGAIHYRNAPDPEQVRQRVLAVLEEPTRQVNMRLSEGKMMTEVRVPIAANKGAALRNFVRQKQLRGVVFAGDDTTDLDAMLEIERLRAEGWAAYAIVVQHADTPPTLLEHADYAVQGVENMAESLRAMVDLL